MRKFLLAAGVVAALEIPAAGIAAELQSSHLGSSCKSSGLINWHFVNNQTGGATSGALVAYYDTSGADQNGPGVPGDITLTDSVPEKPRAYAGKSKNAQEAHEAIRPSGETFRTPAELQNVLRGSEFKLYDLIWKRTVASQMADAKGQTATVTIAVGPTAADAPAPEGATTPVAGTTAEFSASGTVITFRGFLAAYEESRDEERNADDAPGEHSHQQQR